MATVLYVEGMSCRACENRLRTSLLKVPGVQDARANARAGRVTIHTSRAVPLPALRRAISAAGDYRLGGPKPWLTRDGRVWRELALAAGAVALLAAAVRASGLGSLADGVGGAVATGSLALVALLGVAAGFSTCMAMVGGLVLAFSARGAGGAGRAGWGTHVAFNAGRVVGFAALGALTGLAGTAVTLSGPALGVAMIVVAVVMTLLGIQLSGASPRLSAGLVPVLPDAVSQRLERAATSSSGSRWVAPAAVGAATYVLPCGFTQAVQLYALSTGSPARGAAIMAAFALGTAPGLLAVGGVSASVRGAWVARFGRFAAAAVIAFAAVNAAGGVGLVAPGLAGAGLGPGAPAAAAALVDGEQRVRTTQVADGYEPARAVVVAGVPVVWEVTSEAMTCASWLHAPALGVPPGTVLPPGETTEFRFTPTEPGTYAYSCGMGMYWGEFQVVAPA